MPVSSADNMVRHYSRVNMMPRKQERDIFRTTHISRNVFLIYTIFLSA